MRRGPLLLVLGLVLATALAFGGLSQTTVARVAGIAETKPTPTPRPTPEPTPTPTSEPSPEPLPEAEPFQTRVTRIDILDADNAVLYGGTGPRPSEPAVLQAVDDAVRQLDSFLDAQFVSIPTRLGVQGVAVLVDPGLLDADTRGALGVVPEVVSEFVLGTSTGASQASAHVIVSGDVVETVSLTYSATLDLTLLSSVSGVDSGTDTDSGNDTPLSAITDTVTHDGVVVFMPSADGLHLQALEPHISYGPELQQVLG